MKTIFIIFKKEMTDVLRDRRTLLAMIVMPLVLMPLIFSVMSSFTASQMESAMDKKLRVAITDNDNGAELLKRLKRRKDMTVYENIAASDFKSLIREDSIDMAVVVNNDFDKAIAEGKTGGLEVYFNSTENEILYDRLEKTLLSYHESVLAERMDSIGVEEAWLEPTIIAKKDVYSKEESIGKLIGGILPYMFVLFAFMGAMYPAIDLFTGEKERSTIETLLSVPTSRLKILIGKMGVIIFGVLSGMLTILGMFVALKLNPDIPGGILNVVQQILNPTAIILTIILLIPLTTFFAGILIPASIYSKSFKEAQSIIQPLLIVIIIPLVIGTLPGIKLNFGTALVPVLNMALASREIIAGTIDYGLLLVVFLSLMALAAIGISLCVRWFGHEGNILRI